MNQPEALLIVEIVVGSAAGLAVTYYGGRIILNGLRSRHQDRNDVSSALPSTPARPANTTGSSQMSRRDQRPDTIRPSSNRGQRPSSKKQRRNSR